MIYDIYLYTLCYYICCLLGACMRCTRLCPLKPGVTRTELPNITDSNVIGAFLTGTTCRDLVSKLGHKTPTKASELMDIATKFASGQEAIEAIFRKDKQPQGR
jgi:ribose 5-phosphate isomerase